MFGVLKEKSQFFKLVAVAENHPTPSPCYVRSQECQIREYVVEYGLASDKLLSIDINAGRRVSAILIFRYGLSKVADSSVTPSY